MFGKHCSVTVVRKKLTSVSNSYLEQQNVSCIVSSFQCNKVVIPYFLIKRINKQCCICIVQIVLL